MTDVPGRIQEALRARYRIERELGSGGMAVVYLADDLKHGRRVAIKVLRPELVPTLGAERFLREIGIAARLSHPNIVPLHDSGEADGLLYYVMPFVEGESLRDRLRREGRLPLADALRIAHEIADALAFAHAQGVVHRDIKPENVLLQAGHAVVTDFGIARALHAAGGDHVTESGAVVGTIAYMSPEQASGLREVDGRSDIYSLGCVLQEMLVGEVPWMGARSRAGSIASNPREPGTHIPASIEPLLARALAVRPDERFATTAEFRTALEEAEASTVGRAVQRNERRRRAPLAIGLGAVLVAAVWWGAVGRGDRERAIRLAVLPFANITSDSSQEYFSDGLTEEMITQLSILQPRRLKVIGRASIMRYKAATTPVDQIGRELDVAYVLTGSVRREGDRVRIGAQLVRTREQEQVWSDDFDRELTDILALQGDVAKGVARSLALVLLPAEAALLDSGRAVNPRAYEAYLKGHEYARRLSSADLDLALQFFELAMREDSLYALAYIGIAQVWGSRSQMGFANPREAAPKVAAALSRALELDSLLPELHYRLATRATWTEWDWKKGEREFRRAIELNPRYAEAKALYGHLLSILGRRDEALTQLREALEIDPLSDELHALYAVVLNHAGRHREALAEAHIALRTAPGNVIAQNNVMNAFEHLGMHDSSIAAERRARLARNDKAVVEALDRGMAEGGFIAAKQRVADVLAARAEAAGTAPMAVANHYADAGDTARALEWIERSFDRHDPNIPYLSVARNWDPLRGQPRFRALLDSLRLPSVPR